MTCIALVLLPLLGWALAPPQPVGPDGPEAQKVQEPAQGLLERPNATTLAVLLANRPQDLTEEEWLRMMCNPVNIPLFPLRVTRAMLDTLDGREMDLRYRYMLVE